MISIQTEIQITQSIVYLIATAIPIYLTHILKKRDDGSNNNHNFKLLTTILASFVLMQGFYHIVGAFGFSLFAKGGTGAPIIWDTTFIWSYLFCK